MSGIPHNLRLAVEGADVSGEGVEIVKAGVVGGDGDAVDGTEGVEMPGGEDEERTSLAGVETGELGLP